MKYLSIALMILFSVSSFPTVDQRLNSIESKLSAMTFEDFHSRSPIYKELSDFFKDVLNRKISGEELASLFMLIDKNPELSEELTLSLSKHFSLLDQKLGKTSTKTTILGTGGAMALPVANAVSFVSVSGTPYVASAFALPFTASLSAGIVAGLALDKLDEKLGGHVGDLIVRKVYGIPSRRELAQTIAEGLAAKFLIGYREVNFQEELREVRR